MLSVRALSVRYGSITAVRGATIEVAAERIVGVIGPNGAGKTTLLNTIAGLLRPAAGTLVFDGRDVTAAPPDRMLRLGLALVPERRRLFSDLTVHENLLVAGVTVDRTTRAGRLEEMAELFPALRERWDVAAGYLSGGEAQQLAIARALMSGPRMLLLDEPTLGLAPALVDHVFGLVTRLRDEGCTLLVVEQNARKLLEVADSAYVMRTGTIVAEGTASDLLSRPDLFEVYLGVSG